MAVIRVNPESVRAYGATANQQLEAISRELTVLVSDAVGVRYQGPNAQSFKSECGRMCAELGSALNQDLQSIAQAVSSATSGIAGALGGAAVVVDVSGKPIAVPAVPAGDGTLDVDTSGLESLVGTVGNHLTVVDGALDDNLSALRGTDWEGNAKEQAVAQVARFTNTAKGKVAEGRTSITNYIQQQIQSVHAADKA